MIGPHTEAAIIMATQEEDWRRHGKARRLLLLNQDEIDGGTNFVLSTNCRVERYFDVADRVLAQFRTMYANRCNMEECFVMGHRLVIFLAKALPAHPEYHSFVPAICKLREKSRRDLDWIHKRLEVVALRIDEDQLNQYILNDLGLRKNKSNGFTWQSTDDAKTIYTDDTVNVSIESEDLSGEPAEQWERFDGWEQEEKSHGYFHEWENAHDITFEVKPEPPTQKTTTTTNSGPMFLLQQIAKEEVHYESDSEAADSWAPTPPRHYSRATFSSALPQRSTVPGDAPKSPNVFGTVHPLHPHATTTQRVHGYSPDRSFSGSSSGSSYSAHSPEKENPYESNGESSGPTDMDVDYESFPRRRVRFNEKGNQLNVYELQEEIVEPPMLVSRAVRIAMRTGE